MQLNESKIAVLRVFFDEPNQEFYLSQLSSITGLSLDTTHRSLCFWTEKNVLSFRKIGRMKLYRLNRCELTKIMERLVEVENG
jgi:hypothetical protein